MKRTILDLLHEGQTRDYTYSLSLIEPDGEHEIWRNTVDMTEWELTPEILEKDLASIQQIYPGMDSGWYSLIVTRTEQYVGDFGFPSVEIFFFAGDYRDWQQVPESVHRYIRLEQYTRCAAWRKLQDYGNTVIEYFSEGESFKIQFPVIASCYFK